LNWFAAWTIRLRCKHFSQPAQYFPLRDDRNLPDKFDQTYSIHCSELIENDLSLLPFELAGTRLG
jgi:hypothetical protein